MTASRETPPVGVFGGTFNPIHLGHLRAAEEVVETLGLERLVFVPAAQPPHKAANARDAIAPAELRLAWVRLAASGNPRFQVDPLEVEREGRSYSVDTLRVMRERFAPRRPIFVIGCDAFAEIDTWREPKTLLTLADFAVLTRPPARATSLAPWIPDGVAGELELAADGRSARHRTADTQIRLVEIASLEISASEVRRLLREERSVRYLLPEAVHDAVLRSGAYAKDGSGAVELA